MLAAWICLKQSLKLSQTGVIYIEEESLDSRSADGFIVHVPSGFSGLDGNLVKSC